MEEPDIPKNDLTEDVMMVDVGKHVLHGNYAVNTTTSCESAHDTDSTFSLFINVDYIIKQDIINDQAEWESE